MDIRGGLATTVAVLVAATWGTSLSQAAPSCVPVEPGHTRTLLDRVPVLVSARMTATQDGGVVIAFASYRGTREFPGSNFSVLALDQSGCVRWRASLPGPWPIARPVQADAGSIVVASATLGNGEPRGAGGLRVYTLSAATGRLLHRDVFPSLASSTGHAPTVLGDRHGDIAVVLATIEASGPPRGGTPVTIKLTRRARAPRWGRQVIARANIQPPAAVARSNGEMVVGYPRKDRFWVRTGTVAGRLGPPMDAGPVAGNFKPAAVALGPNGTIAAVWQSGTYHRPWRLRAAIRPAGAERFARFAQLGLGTSFIAESSPGVKVGADGQVTAAFFAPSGAPGGQRVMCANATPTGRFGAAHQVALGGPLNPLDQAPMLFGPANSGAVLTSMPNGDSLTHSLVTVGAGCHPRSSAPLDPGAGFPQQAVIDSRRRTWVLGQDLYGASTSARRRLLLTIGAPAR
jgi:hypothetical protein